VVDFDGPVEALTRMRIPRSFNGRNAQSRRDLANALTSKIQSLPRSVVEPVETDGARGRGRHDSQADREITHLRAEIRRHPCHSCPDRESHARWAERWHRLDREASALRRRIETRTNTIARQFDRVCDVLGSLGYLADDEVSPAGQRLMRLYSEMDLLAAECLRAGLWDGLSAPDLAAALAVLVFEARRADDASSPRLPNGPVREVIRETVVLWGRLDRLEKENRLDFLREPDLGFAWAAQAWAGGASLDDVLTETDLAAGDFVRWMKQLLDLAGQVADAAAGTELRETARQTIGALRRGVVAYSSLTD
jgi:ATP-dependent RNA helicase HelY